MTLIRCLAFAAIAAVSLPVARAQEISKEVKVEFKRVEVGGQNTPQIQAQNVKDKRWNPKTWLEIDAGFALKKAKTAEDKNPVVDSLEFKYFLVLNKRENGKFIMLTATIAYINADEAERELHAMAFVSPSSLARVLGTAKYTTPEIIPTSWAIVVSKAGAIAGFKSEGPGVGQWWEKVENFAIIDGVLLPKSKTPFAPLWGDYDLETAK